MSNIEIRDVTADDFSQICALNLSEVAHTSPMDEARLCTLANFAGHHRVACLEGRVIAFLLAMNSEAAYENDNFSWFSGRYSSFIYVDRIVVSSDFQGARLGSRLYKDLFGFAKAQGIPLVTCEYNITPPNEPSRRFHDSFGFKEYGRQWVADNTKHVSLQAAET